MIITEENQKLILDVADGNPGAITVIRELMWFSRWQPMMYWCKKNGLTGPELWMKYKDVFRFDSHALGEWIQEQMARQHENNVAKKPDSHTPLFLPPL